MIEEDRQLTFQAQCTLSLSVPGQPAIIIEMEVPLSLYTVGEVGTSLQRRIYNALLIALQEVEATRPKEST